MIKNINPVNLLVFAFCFWLSMRIVFKMTGYMGIFASIPNIVFFGAAVFFCIKVRERFVINKNILQVMNNIESDEIFKEVIFENEDKNELIREYARKSKLLTGFDEFDSFGVINYNYEGLKVKISEIKTKINTLDMKRKYKIIDSGLFVAIELNDIKDNFTINEKSRLADKIFANKTKENRNSIYGLRDDLKVSSRSDISLDSIISDEMITAMNNNDFLVEVSLKKNMLYVFFNRKGYNINHLPKSPKSKEDLERLKKYLEEYLHPIINNFN